MNKNVVSLLFYKVIFLSLCFVLIYGYEVNAALSSSGVIAVDYANYLKAGSKISLIVGTDFKEDNENSSRFSYSPEADASALLKVLEQNYEFDQTYTLFGKSATKKSILNAIKKIVEIASYNDSIFVFLGGYGVTDLKVRQEGSYLNSIPEIASDLACLNRDRISEYDYLVPYDGSFKDVEKNISVQEIDNLFLQLKSRHLYLIFDAPVQFPLPSGLPVEQARYEDTDYLRKALNSPGRQILTPSANRDLLTRKTGADQSKFVKEILDILLLTGDYLPAKEISNRVYYSLALDKRDSDIFIPGAEIVIYGDGDFIFTVKPEKRALAFEKEISRLTGIVDSLIQNQKRGTQTKNSLIIASEILNWDSLSRGLSSGKHTLDNIVYEHIDKKNQLLLKRGAPFSELDKESILSELNRFVKDNSHYTSDLLKEFGLLAEAERLAANEVFVLEDRLSLNKTLLQRRYPDIFADTRNDYIQKIQVLEKEKIFIDNIMKSAGSSAEYEKNDLKLLSDRNERRKSIKAEIEKEACNEGGKSTDTGAYKKAYFCIKKLSELITLEKEILGEAKSRKTDELNAGIKLPLMIVNRPKSFSETDYEYLFRKEVIGGVLVSGLENKIAAVESSSDTQLKENERIKFFADALSGFKKNKYLIDRKEFKPSFSNYDKKKGRGEIILEIEEPVLLMLPNRYEMEITDKEWDYLKDNKKDILWQIGFTYNDKSDPQLVESYIEDTVSGKKFNLYSSFRFIDGGCYKKRWEENFKEEASPIYCVDSFYMSSYEATKEELMNFTAINHVPKDKLDHPATHVTWETAKSYCAGLGGRYGGVFRLPTKTEWEYAASIKGEKIIYVTGSSEFSREKINIRGKEGNDEWDWTSPVGSFPPNSLGIFDLAGNVDEWVLDWDENEKLEGTVNNYKGPSKGKGKLIMGGSWVSDRTDLLFSTKKSWDPVLRNGTIGFRCIKENESERKE